MATNTATSLDGQAFLVRDSGNVTRLRLSGEMLEVDDYRWTPEHAMAVAGVLKTNGRPKVAAALAQLAFLAATSQ